MNILFYIPYFRKAALRFAFDKQSKPKDFSKLSLAFIDSNGKRYFTWNDKTDMPIKRMQAIQVCLLELQAGITGDELHIFLDAMDKALQKTIIPEKGQKVSGLSEIGYLITEMRMRKNNLIHEEILFKVASLVFVREDESLSNIDEELEQVKITQFRKDADGGLHDFFYGSALKEFIPFANMSAEELKDCIQKSKLRMQSMKMMIDRLHSSEPPLSASANLS